VILYIVASSLWADWTRRSEEHLSGQPGPQIVEKVPFAVKVTVDKLGARGSGTLIRGDMVLTSHSIVAKRKNAETITVTFQDGFQRAASIVKTDPILGLALLRIKPVLYPSANPALLGTVKRDTVTIYGFSAGEISAQVIGRVVAFRAIRRNGPREMFLVNNKSLPGMVGGPVLNSSGDMVGILYGSWVYSNCTSLDTIKKFLEDVN
jgi:S1-C subfamily serine protease